MDEDEKKAAVQGLLANIFRGLAKTIGNGARLGNSGQHVVVEFDATEAYKKAAETLGVDPADLTTDQRRRALIEAMDELAEEGK